MDHVLREYLINRVGQKEADHCFSDIRIASGTDARIIFFQIKALRSQPDSPGKSWTPANQEI